MSTPTAPTSYPPSACDETTSLIYPSVSPPSTAGREGGREGGKEGGREREEEREGERGRGRGRGKGKKEGEGEGEVDCQPRQLLVYAREISSNHRCKT